MQTTPGGDASATKGFYNVIIIYIYIKTNWGVEYRRIISLGKSGSVPIELAHKDSRARIHWPIKDKRSNKRSHLLSVFFPSNCKASYFSNWDDLLMLVKQ